MDLPIDQLILLTEKMDRIKETLDLVERARAKLANQVDKSIKVDSPLAAVK